MQNKKPLARGVWSGYFMKLNIIILCIFIAIESDTKAKLFMKSAKLDLTWEHFKMTSTY